MKRDCVQSHCGVLPRLPIVFPILLLPHPPIVGIGLEIVLPASGRQHLKELLLSIGWKFSYFFGKFYIEEISI